MATLRPAVERLASSYRLKLKQIGELQYRIKTMQINNSYYNQIGLLYHDVMHHTPVIAEAVRRLPREEAEARDFRISRAFHLSANKSVLPRDQWVTLEEDIPYLDPYIELITKEWRDKADWDNFVNPKEYF